MPHTYNLSDHQLGLLLVVLLPVLGGLLWLYNACRMGKLKRKPTAPANPRLVTVVIFLIIVLAVVLLAAAK